MIDAQTLEIRAIEVTSDAIGDAPMLPELLAQIPDDEPIASVSADGAHDTRDCLDAIAQRGAQAVIPPRKNASLWKQAIPGSASRNEVVQACKRFGGLCGKSGVATTGAVWWRPRCTASSAWANG